MKKGKANQTEQITVHEIYQQKFGIQKANGSEGEMVYRTTSTKRNQNGKKKDETYKRHT